MVSSSSPTHLLSRDSSRKTTVGGTNETTASIPSAERIARDALNGGNKLKGEITPQGAKNEALQIISAVLLTPEKVTISNIPDILDVNLLIELLGEMGVKTERVSRDTCIFQADTIDINYLRSDAFRNKSGKLRGSVMMAGPMLARYRKAFIPKPGGDKIGRRRLDTHIIAFETLGGRF